MFCCRSADFSMEFEIHHLKKVSSIFKLTTSFFNVSCPLKYGFLHKPTDITLKTNWLYQNMIRIQLDVKKSKDEKKEIGNS